ncbi:MAG TPA: hypothetical protein VFY17_07810 [Pilimelia sp.]|nr:hypothetical protein [Pilimelia sp.]
MWQAVRRELTGALRSVRYDLYQHSADPAHRPRPLRRLGYVVGGTALLGAAGGFAVVQLGQDPAPAPPPAAFPAPPREPSAGTLGAHAPEPPPSQAAAPRRAVPAPAPTRRVDARAQPGPGATRPSRPAGPRAVWQGRRMPAATLVPGVPVPAGPRRTPPPRPQAPPEEPPPATPVVDDTRHRMRLYPFRHPHFDSFRGRYRGHGHAHRDPYRR